MMLQSGRLQSNAMERNQRPRPCKIVHPALILFSILITIVMLMFLQQQRKYNQS